MSALENRKKVLQVEFDFAKDGGAVGDIVLRGGGLPVGAIVDSGLIDVQTGLTSGGAATVALKLVGAGDVKAAAVLSNFTAGLKACVVDGTAANAVKTTALTNLVMSVAVAPLTAGKMVIPLEYFITE